MSDTPLSNAISAKITNVIQEGLAETGGGFLSGYIGLVTYIDSDGDRCYSMITSGLPAMDALGHLAGLEMVLQADARRALGIRDIEEGT